MPYLEKSSCGRIYHSIIAEANGSKMQDEVVPAFPHNLVGSVNPFKSSYDDNANDQALLHISRPAQEDDEKVMGSHHKTAV